MGCRSITTKDRLIWQLLKDRDFKVTRDGRVWRKNKDQEFKEAGCTYSSRDGTKLYRRVRYRGARLYVHRIIWAAFRGYLNRTMTVNHIDLNGLNNSILNLELVRPSTNLRHAKTLYRRMGMTAIQARTNWINGNKYGTWEGING